MKLISMKGIPVDMARLIAQNEDAIAIGNGKMNARGDQLGRGGKVVKHREDIAREYQQARGPKAVKQVSLKDLKDEVFSVGATLASENMVFQSPDEAVAEVLEKETVKRTRKIKEDTEEEIDK